MIKIPQKTKIIKIEPYDPEWKNEFLKIKNMIIKHVDDLIIRIEHVGSTSVKGLAEIGRAHV